MSKILDSIADAEQHASENRVLTPSYSRGVLARATAARAEHAEIVRIAQAVLECAGVEIGVARTSEDGLSWICPRCKSPRDCRSECTLNELLVSLDELNALLTRITKDGKP